MQGKWFIINHLTGSYNPAKDAYKIMELNNLVSKIQEKIVPNVIAKSIDQADVIITLSDVSKTIGHYSDGSIAERLDIRLEIKTKEEKILFDKTFYGAKPPDKIYKMLNERANSVQGSVPTAAVLEYIDNLLRGINFMISDD